MRSTVWTRMGYRGHADASNHAIIERLAKMRNHTVKKEDRDDYASKAQFGPDYAFHIELLKTIDDASEKVASELSDQWDQLKGIAEAGREVQLRLDDLRDIMGGIARTLQDIERNGR